MVPLMTMCSFERCSRSTRIKPLLHIHWGRVASGTRLQETTLQWSQCGKCFGNYLILLTHNRSSQRSGKPGKNVLRLTSLEQVKVWLVCLIHSICFQIIFILQYSDTVYTKLCGIQNQKTRILSLSCRLCHAQATPPEF